jgi:hypothetical protein
MQLPVGVTLKGVCDLYSHPLIVLAPPGCAKTAALKALRTIFADPAVRPAAAEQRQALYRVSFSRSRQKRGPPSLPL